MASLPFHAPLPAQEVALLLDHVNVELAPRVTDVGAALSVTLGAGGGVTVTVADACDDPLVPLQVRP
jgi:hypothetical protein